MAGSLLRTIVMSKLRQSNRPSHATRAAERLGKEPGHVMEVANQIKQQQDEALKAKTTKGSGAPTPLSTTPKPYQ